MSSDRFGKITSLLDRADYRAKLRTDRRNWLNNSKTSPCEACSGWLPICSTKDPNWLRVKWTIWIGVLSILVIKLFWNDWINEFYFCIKYYARFILVRLRFNTKWPNPKLDTKIKCNLLKCSKPFYVRKWPNYT